MPPAKFYAKVGDVIREILGDFVINAKDNQPVAVADLSERSNQIGLYFATDYCVRSQRFTPQLINYYNGNIEIGAADLEIVLINTQTDEEKFRKFASTMPWHYVDFKEHYARQVIPKKYGITELPKLIFLDSKSGEIMTEDGMYLVERQNERRLSRNLSTKSAKSSFSDSFNSSGRRSQAVIEEESTEPKHLLRSNSRRSGTRTYSGGD